MTTVATARIRILFLITQFDTGGVQFQLYLRLAHLNRDRFDPHVLVLTGGESYLLAKVRALGVPVTALRLEDCSLGTKVSKIRRAITAVRPDIVDSMLGWDITYGNAAATLAKVPFIVAEIQNERRAVTAETSRSFRMLQALALRWFCDAVVCCSNGARDSYLEVMPWLSRRATVIHDAIDGAATVPQTREADRAALGIPANAVVVGTIGRLVEQKDHATLVRAASRVCGVRRDVHIVIAGYGHLRDSLLRQIESVGLSDRVRLIGEITDPQRFYAMTDIFVMTSRWEGFPVVLLEAMMAAKPVVSTQVGGIAEMIEHGRSGFLCPAGDAERIADSLLRCAEDAELRFRLAARGRERVADLYSIQRLIASWEQLYEKGATAATSRGAEAVPVTSTPASAITWPAASSRILVWRLCPFREYGAVITQLRARYPAARIDSVCQGSAAEPLHAIHGDGSTTIYGEGPFSLFKLGFGKLLRLRRSGYDLVVVPYNTAGRGQYRHAEAAAALIAPGRAFGIAPSVSSDQLATALSVGDVLRGLPTRGFSAVTSVTTLLRAMARGIARGLGASRLSERPQGTSV